MARHYQKNNTTDISSFTKVAVWNPASASVSLVLKNNNHK